jgi:hypothetical protein
LPVVGAQQPSFYRTSSDIPPDQIPSNRMDNSIHPTSEQRAIFAA